ncbi:hypothetical protein BC941DRAFT_476864 [Chlamydoabsidia padenii]|nr:hypothetical protein BC941DRAFT_476864 [Chlamydoabsidia padenii]
METIVCEHLEIAKRTSRIISIDSDEDEDVIIEVDNVVEGDEGSLDFDFGFGASVGSAVVDDPVGGAPFVDGDPSVDQSDSVLDLLYRGDTEQQRLNHELYMRDIIQKDQATIFNTTTNRDQYLDDVIRFRRARHHLQLGVKAYGRHQGTRQQYYHSAVKASKHKDADFSTCIDLDKAIILCKKRNSKFDHNIIITSSGTLYLQAIYEAPPTTSHSLVSTDIKAAIKDWAPMDKLKAEA